MGWRRLPALGLGVALLAACRSPSRPPAPALSFVASIVELAPALGERHTADARLSGPAVAHAHLTIDHVDDPALHVEVLAPDGSGAAGLRLTFTGDRAGVRTGQVVVTTGIDEPARLTLLYSLRVPSRITVTPSNPIFDLRDPSGRERLLQARGRGPDFRVAAVEIVHGPFRAAIESDGTTTAGAAAIRVRVDETAICGSPQRGFLGKLRIRDNDPTQPTTDVPLFAMGTPGRNLSDTDADGHGAPPTR